MKTSALILNMLAIKRFMRRILQEDPPGVNNQINPCFRVRDQPHRVDPTQKLTA